MMSAESLKLSMKVAITSMCLSFLVFPLLLVIHSLAFCQVEEAWSVHYDSPYDNDNGGHDWPYDIAVDESGNIYVTGWSPGRYFPSTWEHDFLTIKYDPEGNELWVARYEWGGHDGAKAIALDPEANVYVTGFSEYMPYAHDYLTIKYDTDGNELWSARWQGEAVDGPKDIVVDDLGNVYVTGWTESFGTGSDYLTIKYDTNGNELWTARYDGGTEGYSASPNDIAIDSQGNVYVTGTSSGFGTGADYVTIKYDTDGNELWLVRYNGPYSGLDAAVAVAVDKVGNVYVTGRGEVKYSVDHYITVKYDTHGNELWVAQYCGPYDGGGNFPEAMTIDVSGNVYVTGESYGIDTFRDYATVKYDTDGNEIWAARYDQAGFRDHPRDIAVDIDGSVVVTGSSYYGDLYYEEDIVTVKYDANGNEIWLQSFDEVGRDDIANAIALDREGNVCVTGWSTTGWHNVYTTIKYVPTVSLGFTCLTPFVKRGGSLQYEATLANNTSESQDFWAWLKVKLPTSEWYEDYLLPPTPLTLDPDEERTYPVFQDIPLSALLGRYEYWGYIGSDTLAVWDCDMFQFSVYSHPH
ncbi:MAG: SBBP repeat-containing protein, partial [Candidatus Glassbacteria bacterium]